MDPNYKLSFVKPNFDKVDFDQRLADLDVLKICLYIVRYSTYISDS